MFTAEGAVMLMQAAPALRPDTAGKAIVRTPLPRGVGTFVRTVLNAPSWLQVTVIAMGVLTFAAIAFWIFRRRRAILEWLVARSLGWKIALAGIAVVAVTGAASFGVVSWNYTQHNNDFCIGCHVMGSAWQRFQHSEHRKLKCHDCHQQSIVASMRQLYLWVAERPNAIPPHAKVPTRICENCHNAAKPDSVWQHIIATAGHSVHLRNDDPRLRNVQCVTCHGAEVHHFGPIDKTCGQSGCHEKIHIQLGKMAAQTSLHCTGCHAFTQQVADNLSPDSTRLSLVPTGGKCLDCHQMKDKVRLTLAELSPAHEPHKAVCGACHDPHKQVRPEDAFRSCATAQCHARADTLTPFHRGLPTGALANCGSCHKAHVWKVQSKDCVACHQKGGVIPERRSLGTGPPDTTQFDHAKHMNVPCTSCHSSERSHGEVTIRQPDGCQSCHHGPAQKATCTTCHTALIARPQTVSMTTTVWSGTRTRTLPFAHDRHAAIQCKSCHTTSLTLAIGVACASCHVMHHTATADCASCHPSTPIAAQAAFHPRAATHEGCGGAACHRDASVLALPATRNVCLSCHRDKSEHKPGAACAACHLVGWEPEPNGADQ